MEFEDTFVSEMKDTLKKLNYHSFTEIQQNAINEIRNGKNIQLLSPTGSGKTITYVIPIIEKINLDENKTQCIVLVPTRELAIQVRDLFRMVDEHITCSVLFGGSNQKSQSEILKKGVHILVMTPGKARELILKKKIKLEYLNTVVLDEVDHLLEKESKKDIECIFSHLQTEVQTLLFSATSHKNVETFSNRYLKDVTLLQQESKLDLPKIQQQYYWVEEKDKLELLIKLLNEHNITHALIFASTKEKASFLSKQLKEKNISAKVFHHDIEKEKRVELMSQISSNHPLLLITTDITARGINIPTLPYVIQYDAPQSVSTYVHRIGRTGRNHQHGISIAFFTKKEEALKLRIEKKTSQQMINKTKKKNVSPTHKKKKKKKKHQKNIGKRNFKK